MTDQKNTDAHDGAVLSLIGITRAGVQALKVAVRDVETAPKTAHKAISTQATLISKALSKLSDRIDHLPPVTQAQADPMDTANAVDIEQVTDVLRRVKRAAMGLTCNECGLLLPFND